MGRPTIIAGNWKMHMTASETTEYAKNIAPLIVNSQAEVFLAPPFTSLESAIKAAQGTKICVGAQNMHFEDKGAFTGEISASMLLEIGASFVILGHSERRHVFGEDDAIINKKVKKAFASGLRPVLCIGETLEEREKGATQELLKKQIMQGLEGVAKEEFSKVILAYEPVWAIGTGKTATPEIAQEAHEFCRSIIAEMSDSNVAEQIPILYGGSAKPDNASILMAQKDIDGLLVGGASLQAESFSKIVNYHISKKV